MKLLVIMYLLISSPFLYAMQLGIFWDCDMMPRPSAARVHSNNKVTLDPEWEGSKIKGMPRQITILKKDSPISDELLLKLNPAFAELKEKLPAHLKNEILYHARWYPGGDFNQHVSRSLIALGVCIGADINQKAIDETPLETTITHTDVQLAKYLLAKGANYQMCRYFRDPLICGAKSIELAQVLIDNGAEIPSTILNDCASDMYPADLMQFYFNKGFQPTINRELWTPLHNLSYQSEKPAQILKTQMLLKSGEHLLHQDRLGRTFLHLMAQHKNKKLCIAVIHHFLERNKGYLQFLAHIKNVCPTLYKTKGLHKQFFMESASHMKNLRQLLSLKTNDGKTAFDFLPMKELDPKNYSYEKLK